MPKSSSVTTLLSTMVKLPMPGSTNPLSTSQPKPVALTKHTLALSKRLCPCSPHKLNKLLK